MPLTKSGQEVLASMKKQYGEKKGKEVFYASINKGKAGSAKWHGKSKAKKSSVHKKALEVLKEKSHGE